MEKFVENAKAETGKRGSEAFFEMIKQDIGKKGLFAQVFEKATDEKLADAHENDMLRAAGIESVTDFMLVLADLEQKNQDYSFHFEEDEKRVKVSVTKR